MNEDTDTSDYHSLLTSLTCYQVKCIVKALDDKRDFYKSLVKRYAELDSSKSEYFWKEQLMYEALLRLFREYL